MKIGIVTFYEEKHASYGTITARNKQAYADNYGYVFREYRSLQDPIRSAYWNKIAVVRKTLRELDVEWLLWSDSDAYIVHQEIPLEQFALAAGEHNVVMSSDRNGLNMGNFLIRRCDWSFEFLRALYDYRPIYESAWWDQSTMFTLLQLNPEWVDKIQDVVGKLSSGLTGTGFIHHLAGWPDGDRYKLVRSRFDMTPKVEPEIKLVTVVKISDAAGFRWVLFRKFLHYYLGLGIYPENFFISCISNPDRENVIKVRQYMEDLGIRTVRFIVDDGTLAQVKEEQNYLRLNFCKANDWIMPINMEEFVEFSDVAFLIAREMEKAGHTMLFGQIVDRFAPLHRLQPFDENGSLFDQYPIQERYTPELESSYMRVVLMRNGPVADEKTSTRPEVVKIHYFNWDSTAGLRSQCQPTPEGTVDTRVKEVRIEPLSYAQNEEDLQLIEFFNQQNEESLFKRVLDIGAGDGLHFSNSRKLINNGWSGVLVEASPVLFPKLLQLYEQRPDVHLLNGLLLPTAGVHPFCVDREGFASTSVMEIARMRANEYYRMSHAVAVSPHQFVAAFGNEFDLISIDTWGDDIETVKLFRLLLPKVRVFMFDHTWFSDQKNLAYYNRFRALLDMFGLSETLFTTKNNTAVRRPY